MGCSSCAKKRKAQQETYEVKFADGSTRVYSTEREAKAAAVRRGGTVRRNN